MKQFCCSISSTFTCTCSIGKITEISLNLHFTLILCLLMVTIKLVPHKLLLLPFFLENNNGEREGKKTFILLLRKKNLFYPIPLDAALCILYKGLLMTPAC